MHVFKWHRYFTDAHLREFVVARRSVPVLAHALGHPVCRARLRDSTTAAHAFEMPRYGKAMIK